MGYSSSFQITLLEGHRREFAKVLEAIEKKNHELDEKTRTTGFYAEEHWYDCIDDCMEISRRFPGIMFEVEGHGEDSQDNWRARFHGGESEIVEMVWPPFKIILTDKERNPEP